MLPPPHHDEVQVGLGVPLSNSVLFCSVLHPSSIRGLATPWTYFLHLSLSSAILIDSSMVSLVHVLMLSIQAVRGLPRLACVHAWHCSLHYLFLPCFLMVWPKYACFLALTVFSSSFLTPALLRIHSFVFLAVHKTRSIFFSPFISKASRRLSSFF